jgi:hypothetical protein
MGQVVSVLSTLQRSLSEFNRHPMQSTVIQSTTTSGTAQDLPREISSNMVPEIPFAGTSIEGRMFEEGVGRINRSGMTRRNDRRYDSNNSLSPSNHGNRSMDITQHRVMNQDIEYDGALETLTIKKLPAAVVCVSSTRPGNPLLMEGSLVELPKEAPLGTIDKIKDILLEGEAQFYRAKAEALQYFKDAILRMDPNFRVVGENQTAIDIGEMSMLHMSGSQAKITMALSRDIKLDANLRFDGTGDLEEFFEDCEQCLMGVPEEMRGRILRNGITGEALKLLRYMPPHLAYSAKGIQAFLRSQFAYGQTTRYKRTFENLTYKHGSSTTLFANLLRNYYISDNPTVNHASVEKAVKLVFIKKIPKIAYQHLSVYNLEMWRIAEDLDKRRQYQSIVDTEKSGKMPEINLVEIPKDEKATSKVEAKEERPRKDRSPGRSQQRKPQREYKRESKYDEFRYNRQGKEKERSRDRSGDKSRDGSRDRSSKDFRERSSYKDTSRDRSRSSDRRDTPKERSSTPSAEGNKERSNSRDRRSESRDRRPESKDRRTRSGERESNSTYNRRDGSRSREGNSTYNRRDGSRSREGNSTYNRRDGSRSRDRSPAKREDKCFFCGKTGHWAQECYKKADQESKRGLYAAFEECTAKCVNSVQTAMTTSSDQLNI